MLPIQSWYLQCCDSNIVSPPNCCSSIEIPSDKNKTHAMINAHNPTTMALCALQLHTHTVVSELVVYQISASSAL